MSSRNPAARRALEPLEDVPALGVPLDRHREWYHYHHLFHELLQTELDRREPELVQRLQARAADWCEANGLPELAIGHAQAAGDADRVARLVESLAFPAYASGRAQTARGWFRWFEERGLIERYPLIATQGAFLQVLAGEPEDIERWAAAAERGLAVRTLAPSGAMKPWMALLRALLCRDGVEQMRADAAAAVAGLAPGSPWSATALLLEGVAHVLAGRTDRADPILAHAAEVAAQIGALPAAAAALAQRALIAVARHDWIEAESLAGRGLEIARAGQLNDYEMSPLLHAVAARSALHYGDVPRAQDHLARAAHLRPRLTAALPHRAVQTLLELTRAHLALTDVAGARRLLREARIILHQRPHLGTLPAQAAQLQARLDTLRETTTSVATLTAAELRLLPLLSTHLSFREIGERLYLSQHTVKSQALSVYRKLGVSSRSQAIQRVQQTGLPGA
ncbi:MAG TPA: LuxR C-terminal-related transcriptional regulator [Actinomycetota bacterium]|nr:LuxR C-terminal-related transcriptional regulator [Actinomycetota bacterium]